MKQRRLEITFTRDFNFWVNQISTDEYHHSLPKVWGKTIEQIITYDGRASHWCRFPEELEKFKSYMSKKPLDSAFFDITEHQKFRENLANLRKLIRAPIRSIKDPAKRLQTLTNLFTYKFSYNALAVFLPGPWKNEFLARHAAQKKQATQIVKWAEETRYHAEGIHKELGDYMRKWLGPKLAENGYPASFVKLLTIKETKALVQSNKLPPLRILQNRAKGFVYIGGRLFPTTDIKHFLLKRSIALQETEVNQKTDTLKGTVACRGKLVRGKVRVIMNSEEAAYFKKGEVLISSMTAPDYLPAMKKAAAIITDEGGLLCHAAIVSRELGIPCIIGTKVASKMLKDGDLVEVDANKGVIKKL